MDDTNIVASAYGIALRAGTNSEIERLEGVLLGVPQLKQNLRHTFSPGVYVRELEIPRGAIVIGHLHKTEHVNMLIKGRMSVVVDGKLVEVSAPFVVNSLPGTRKIGFAHEDSVWANVHATNETDLEKLEDALIEKSDTFKVHELEAISHAKAIADHSNNTIEIT